MEPSFSPFPLLGRCAVCDGGFAPCFVCRLAQGDGEAVAGLCADLSAQMQPPPPLPPPPPPPPPPHCLRSDGGVVADSKLTAFFDFDRTLCTTKSGGSPLQGRHSLDTELAAVAAALPTYVVTRNSHAAEIATFLAQRGVRIAGVKVVPKKESKASAMLALCPELADPDAGLRAVFVDDDVFECIDPAVAALPGLLRVLFRRGAA